MGMRYIKPDYYDNFRCLMGECPSSCCIMWQVVVDEKSFDYYKNLDTDFGKRLRDNIEECDGDICFKNKCNRCSFLNSDNLCDIHINIGAEHMADTCRKFPDFCVENDTVTLCGQSVSCPYVADAIIRHKDRISYILSGNSEPDEYEEDMLKILYLLIDVVYDSKLGFEDTCAELLSVAEKHQQKFCDKYDIDDVYISSSLPDTEDCRGTLSSLETLTEDWKTLVKSLDEYSTNDRFEEYMLNRMYEYKNLLSYFLFRYFMESTGDGNFMLAVRFAVVSVFIIKVMGEQMFNENGEFTAIEQIKLSYLFGKEVEHSEENLDIIFDDIALGFI